MATEARNFDPSRHLSSISGKDYLEVKWRIVWLRTEHPEAEIDTNMESYNGQEAIFKATVKIPGMGSATGWGSEDAQGFGDFLEKAETKAIGRALGALGYGTQFTFDFDYSGVVDSPVQQQAQPSGPRRMGPSEKQMGLIRKLARDLKLSDDQLNTYVEREYKSPLDALQGRDVSNLIDRMKAKVEE